MEKMYIPQIYNEYKTRNILSLAERVEVIREHDRHLTPPSLQSLAHRFQCSSKQIKNILINRGTILEAYRNGTAGQQKVIYSQEDVLQKRQEKIAFLGKVMYEYIQRILYFNQTIDDHKFRQKALQIKECIAVENFKPSNAWLEDFKTTYGITSFDLVSLRNNIVIKEAKRPHLSAIDMIQYVSRMEQYNIQEQKGKIMSESFPKADITVKSHCNSPANNSTLEPKIIYEIEDEEDDEELQKLTMTKIDDDIDDATDKLLTTADSSSNNKKDTMKRPLTTPFPDIESVEEALRHVKALEEYAMLQDNFRAIGLLTQLEQIFRKPTKTE